MLPILLPLKQPRARKPDNTTPSTRVTLEDDGFAIDDRERCELFAEGAIKCLEGFEISKCGILARKESAIRLRFSSRCAAKREGFSGGLGGGNEEEGQTYSKTSSGLKFSSIVRLISASTGFSWISLRRCLASFGFC